MFKISSLTVVLVLFASSLFASDFEFRGLRFGDAPQQNMICLRGDCPEGTVTFARQYDFPNAVYSFPEDITHLGSVPINSPEYDFIEGQLYRIRIILKCTSGFGGQCIESALEEIDANYEYTKNESGTFTSDVQGSVYVELGEIASGDQVKVSWTPEFDIDSLPHIKIQNLDLLEKARMAANPNYISQKR